MYFLAYAGSVELVGCIVALAFSLLPRQHRPQLVDGYINDEQLLRSLIVREDIGKSRSRIDKIQRQY
jgi:hypothetical protein